MKKLLALALSVMCILCTALPAHAESVDKGLFEDIMNQAGASHSSAPQATPVPTQTIAPDDMPAKATGMTLMIYLCGSDLEDQGAASQDLIEIARSGFDASELNVIIMAGGSRRWRQTFIPDGTTGIYRLVNDRAYTLFNDGTAHNMGAPGTLASFIDYAYEQFPAREYALIMWDHGGGSLSGLCHDVNFDYDSLSSLELNAALYSSAAAGQKLSWIGFDACLMATAEVAKIVSPYADYMVASEEVEPGAGWDYSFLKGMTAEEDPAVTGKRIVDSYFAYYEEIGLRSTNLTLSCLDLSLIDEVADAAGDFFGSTEVSSSTYAALSRQRRNIRAFGRNAAQSKNDYDLIDLGSAATKLVNTRTAAKANALKKAVNDCVVYTRSLSGDCTGMSVYSPFFNKSIAPSFVSAYPRLGFSKGYEDYIEAFSYYLTSSSSTRSITPGTSIWADADTQREEMERDVRTVFNLILTPEQLAEIGEAHIVALQQSAAQPDAWHLVATQGATLDEASGTLSGSYVHTNLFVTGPDGQPLHDLPIVYTEMDNGMYIMQAILVDAQQQRFDAQMLLSRDSATDLVTVEAVYLYDEAINNYSPRLTANLADYAAVIYQVTDRVPTRTGSGALLSFEHWDVAATTDCQWQLNGAWQLAFIEEHLDPATLRIAFRITDVYNDMYMSSLLELQNQLASGAAYITTYDDDLLLIDNVNIVAASNSNMRLVASITNRTQAEVLIFAENVAINGQSASTSGEIYGNGEYDGLLTGEQQPLMMLLPMAGVEALHEITFDLVLLNAVDENEIAVVPVAIR